MGMFGKVKISNETCVSALSEINSVAPKNWFVASNNGKDKKLNHAYIVNVLEDAIQLVPIKKQNKSFIVDKDNIIVINESEDIKKCILIVEDTHDHFYIYLNNGYKFKLGIHKKQFDKNRKALYKTYRKRFKKQSFPLQFLDYAFSALVIIVTLLAAICLVFDYSPIAHIYGIVSLKTFVNDAKNAESLNIVLEPYDKADLKAEENYIKVKHGNIEIKIPSNCYIDSENGETDGSVTYINGLSENEMLRINIEYESYDFDYDEEFSEKSKEFYKKISPYTEKEFGFPITGMYHYQKAMWMANTDDINYMDINEVLFYFVLFNLKAPMVPYDCRHVYDIETENYCGFILENGPTPIDVYIMSFQLYPKDNLESYYVVTVASSDLDEAYKILNSVEFVAE